MSEATKGRAREHTVARHMAEAGWELIARAAGSKGPADLILAHPEHGIALVQVGKDTKSLGPSERARLLHAADLCSALPIIARCWHGIAYARVTSGPPTTWEGWTP